MCDGVDLRGTRGTIISYWALLAWERRFSG